MELNELDIFIRIIDIWHNTYKVTVEPCAEYTLHITFEKSFMNPDGPAEYIAAYMDNCGDYLVKFKNKNLNDLIQQVHQWNVKHRVRE